MKVRDLIKELEQYDDDCEVMGYFRNEDDGYEYFRIEDT